MKMSERAEKLWGINEDEKIVVHEGSDSSRLIVVKGEKTKKYGDIDIQIRIEGPGYDDNYTPSHPAVFKDLEMKINSDANQAASLRNIIDDVFHNEDVSNYEGELKDMSFERERFPSDVTVHLTQLMMIEQEINYGPGGKKTYYDPPRDLFMSCIRWIYSGEYDEIGDVIGAGYNGQVPNKYKYDEGDIWKRPRYD